MSDKSAVRPDVFSDFRDIGRDRLEKDAEKLEVDPDDLALSSMRQHSGWPILKEHIQSLKRGMEQMVDALISNGGNFEDIGKITVVTNLCKEKLDDVITYVEDRNAEITK